MNHLPRIEPIRSAATDDHATRRDGASVPAFEGSYGDDVLGKVGKVFADLRRELHLATPVSRDKVRRL